MVLRIRRRRLTRRPRRFVRRRRLSIRRPIGNSYDGIYKAKIMTSYFIPTDTNTTGTLAVNWCENGVNDANNVYLSTLAEFI